MYSDVADEVMSVSPLKLSAHTHQVPLIRPISMQLQTVQLLKLSQLRS